MSGDTDLHFSARDQRALVALLDDVLPASDDGRLPGAGALGVIAEVEELTRRIPGVGSLIAQGLSTLDKLASVRNPDGFAALESPARGEIIEELTAADPGFLPTLTFVAYVGYYQNGRVIESLGLEHRPPHPKGHEMEASDLSLLEPVRRRPKLYREV